MNDTLKFALAQQDYLLGDIEGNTEKIIKTAIHARDELDADVILFSELAITGYPPEDLLLRKECLLRVNAALRKIQASVQDIYLIIGYPEKSKNKLYNSASVIFNGNIIARYHKQRLPNYSVFDEKRYFSAGRQPCIIEIGGIQIAVVICEDLWEPGAMKQAVRAGAELVLSLNASPFNFKKDRERLEQLRRCQRKEGALPILYTNCVGGQDELVFDGGSLAIDAHGEICVHSPVYQEALDLVTVDLNPLHIRPGNIAQMLDDDASLYEAIVLGTRDYIRKSGFSGALLGLSGGIDSALVLAIVCDAIGSERVHAVLMPSRFTAQMSIEDSLKEVENLGVKHSIIPIEPAFNAFLDSLSDEFIGYATDVTEENIQARCRAIILMALSNKLGKIVLACGNKSEMAVGYASLYGDMAGGYAPIKDLPKTLVYRLARYRNKLSPVIPERIFNRPPSAELAMNQTDQDLLPPYEVLDPIMVQYVEYNQGIEDIVRQGFARQDVERVIKLIDHNEYKRRQAAPGVRISSRAFGRDWRFPITSGFRD